MSLAIWKKLHGSGGHEGIWGHTCNAIRDRKLVYIFGGCRKDKYTNQVDIFDTGDMLWIESVIDSTPPIPRVNHTCTTVGDKLFVFGGSDGMMPLDDLHILDTTTNTWILPCVEGDVPDPREGHSASIVGGRLFIFGGCAKYVSKEIYYDDLYIFEIETFKWKNAQTSGTPPSKRSGHTSSSWNNKIVVIGGEDCDCYFSDVHILDTVTLVWSKVDTTGHLFPPRMGHTTISCGQSLFVFGGFSGEMNMFNDLHKFDIGVGAWMKVIPIGEGPSGRFSMAGERLGPQGGLALFFVGGCNNVEANDDIYLLRIEKASVGRSTRTSKASKTPGIEKIRIDLPTDMELDINKLDINRDHGASANPVLAFGTDLPTDMEIDSVKDVDPIMDMDIDHGLEASSIDMITCPDFANDPFFNKADVSWLCPTNYTYAVRNQKDLDVCWAFVATSNIFSNELINHRSPELGSVHELTERVHYYYPVNAVTKVTHRGLKNNMLNAHKYIHDEGLYTEKLLPLQDKCLSTFDPDKGEKIPWIPLRFQGENPYADHKIRVAEYGVIQDSSEYDKIEEMLRKGTIGGAIQMSRSFLQLSADTIWEGPGIKGSKEYIADVFGYEGEFHALDIVSFGGTRGVDDYYTVKNSWGPGWCKDGHGHIRRHTLIDNSISYPVKIDTMLMNRHYQARPRFPPR